MYSRRELYDVRTLACQLTRTSFNGFVNSDLVLLTVFNAVVVLISFAIAANDLIDVGDLYRCFVQLATVHPSLLETGDSYQLSRPLLTADRRRQLVSRR